jgi:hypothetical protein
VLDFDAWDTYLDFLELARATGYGDLVDRVRAGYEERTPNGAHLPWRCKKIAGNTKLAQRSTKDDHGHELCNEHGNPITETLIETRGEGGFTIIAPSNDTVHPSGKPYVLLSGSIATVATVTQEEREELFTLARSFNEVTKAEQKERHHQERESAGDRPGDVFNARATWEEILELRGWLKIYARKDRFLSQRGWTVLRFTAGVRVRLEATDNGSVERLIECRGWQSGCYVGVNVRYLLQALEGLRGDEVTLALKDEASPVHIADEDLHIVISPMRDSEPVECQKDKKDGGVPEQADETAKTSRVE